MFWLAYFIFAFLILRFLVSLSNLLFRQWLKPGTPSGNPLISVLIPARDEERSIGGLLSELGGQDYKNIEIIVYDDNSGDSTAVITESFQKKDRRIRLIRGGPLPAGWLGKNHACHQLAQHAGGEYLMFLDADVTVKPQLLENALAHLQEKKLALLSIFPRQLMQGFGEKITVPVMNWVLTGLLPLMLTRISSWPSFSAANGQFMLFRADIYRKYQFHNELKEHMVEDIAIFRLMKRRGLATHTILSNGDISCRMYSSFGEAITGFSKNVLDFFGGYSLPAVMFALVTGLGFVPVLLWLPARLTVTWFVMIILHRTVISLISRQPIIPNIIYAPLQMFSFWIMIISAIRHRRRGNLIWKGRNVLPAGINP